uniref:Ig-like domain-containing protein n=1 Tax=Strongyloides stercoralis TaxID=6248 RepID=A0A0K0E9H0_STRER
MLYLKNLFIYYLIVLYITQIILSSSIISINDDINSIVIDDDESSGEENISTKLILKTINDESISTTSSSTPFVSLRSVPLPISMDEMLSAGRKAYDKYSTPTQGNNPTQVNLTMYIEGLSGFRTQTMDFQLDVYLQQYWKDERLAHNESSRILVRDKKILDKIWHPDCYFANSRIAEFHSVTQPNFLLWIENDGRILYDTRISMIVMCMMNLSKWPLDSQRCSLRILSYAYNNQEMNIAWDSNEPITRNMDIVMADMRIVDISPGQCNGEFPTGTWSCVTAEFYVIREKMHHVMQFFVPATLIVVISWFSFWLDIESVAARISLSITTLLTLSTQANAARMALPEVSYLKAIDVFMGTCIVFVFAVIIEFTIVNYAQRQATQETFEEGNEKSKRKRKKPCKNNDNDLTQKAKKFLHKTLASFNFTNNDIQNTFCDDTIPVNSIGPMEACYLLLDTLTGTASVNPPSSSNSDSIKSPNENFNESDNSRLTMLHPTFHSVTFEMPNFQEHSFSHCPQFGSSSINSSQHHSPHSALLSHQYNHETLPNTCCENIHHYNHQSSSPMYDWKHKNAERLANWSKIDNNINYENKNKIKKRSITSNIKAFTEFMSDNVSVNTDEKNAHTSYEGNMKTKLNFSDKWASAFRQIQNKKKIAARNNARKIDQKSRWMFPLSFLLFNISFWIYYLYIV